MFRPNPIIIRSSLHNPIVTAFPVAALFPKCRQAVLVSVVVWCSIPKSCGSNIPRACDIRGKISHCCDACDRPRFQSSVVRHHLYFLLFHPFKISCQGDAQLLSAGGPTTMRIKRRYSTSTLASLPCRVLGYTRWLLEPLRLAGRGYPHSGADPWPWPHKTSGA